MDQLAKLVLDGNELWWLREGRGAHGDEPAPADSVESSLSGVFRFVQEVEGSSGLRAPQLGALHAMLAHRSVESDEPITVVMPTGTGKTETMLAAYCHTPRRTLILVPSDALRSQTARKFATLGVLPSVGAVEGEFLCPVVLLLKSGLNSPEQIDRMVGAANVIVSTAPALMNCSPKARARLREWCDRLFVDEAHHVAARTWQSVKELFPRAGVAQFTATPFREDGQHLDGRIAYAYPLRLAQKNGYFARINYHSVVDLAHPDHRLARQAVDQLRRDIASGLDHLLMARVASVARAKEVVRICEEMAADLNPRRIDTGLADSTCDRNKAALFTRESRIAVCVDMLGEGFDLPALRMAAGRERPRRHSAVHRTLYACWGC